MPSVNCEILGSRGRTSQGSGLYSSYVTDKKFYFGHIGPKVSWMSPLIIKFKVPSYSGRASNLLFNLKGYKQGSNSNPTFRYAIASSDANVSLYTNRPTTTNSYYYLPNDPYIIARGTFSIAWKGSSATTISVNCPVNNLNSGAIYYLYIYPYTTTDEYGILYATGDSSHASSCTMTYVTEYYIYYYPNAYDGVTNLPLRGTKYQGVTYYISSTIPIRQNYKFLGWSTMYGSSGTINYKPGDPYYSNENLILYAVWVKDDGCCYICINGEMKKYKPYVYTNGEWKPVAPYVYINGKFKVFS